MLTPIRRGRTVKASEPRSGNDMEYNELRFEVCEPKPGAEGDPRMVAYIEASSTGDDYPTVRAKRLAQVDFPDCELEVVQEFAEDDGRKTVWIQVWDLPQEDWESDLVITPVGSDALAYA